MAVIVDPTKVKSFKTSAAFEAWLSKQHETAQEIWLRIYKKASGRTSITYAEALDVALCWGWIDGIKKSFDGDSFVQRFTPRQKKSIWSQVNREHIARLEREGRMTEHGRREVERAKADGRWDAAYAPIRSASAATIPADLMRAIEASPTALATFRTLDKTNLFALRFRTDAMKTPDGRARKIAALVATLASGQPIVARRTRTP